MVDAGDSMGDGTGNTNRGNGGCLHNFGCDSINRYCIKGDVHWGNDRINGRHYADGSRTLDWLTGIKNLAKSRRHFSDTDSISFKLPLFPKSQILSTKTLPF
jgi:hypothetical protein